MTLERTQREDADFLQEINADNPDAAARLQNLLQAGVSPEEIAARYCDELGYVTYEGPDDPNSPINRFRGRFVVFDHAVVEPSPQRGPAAESLYDASYYQPGLPAIRHTRALVARVLAARETAPTPNLETHEDYLAYFRSFHPAVLSRLLRETYALELNDGCSAHCLPLCYLADKKPTRAIPFQTLQWLADNFAPELREANPLFYHGSDLKYYQDGDKDGTDVLDFFTKAFGFNAGRCLSIAFGLDKKTVEFIYRAVFLKKHRLDRISRLGIAEERRWLEKLVEKIHQRAKRDGYACLDDWTLDTLQVAFDRGAKQDHGAQLGKRVSRDTPESEIATEQIHCQHGVVLKAASGFHGVIIKPSSRLFPKGMVEFPVVPDPQGYLTFPVQQYSGIHLPYAADLAGWNVLRPRFVRMHKTRNISSVIEETNGAEEKIIAASRYKECLKHSAKFMNELSELFQKVEAVQEKISADPSENQLLLKFLHENLDILSLHLQNVFLKREDLCSRFHASDQRILLDIMQFDQALARDITRIAEKFKQHLDSIMRNLGLRAEPIGYPGEKPLFVTPVERFEEIDRAARVGTHLLTAQADAIRAVAEELSREYLVRTGESVDLVCDPPTSPPSLGAVFPRTLYAPAR